MSTGKKLETSKTWTRICSDLKKQLSLFPVRIWLQGVVIWQPPARDWAAYTVRYYKIQITSRKSHFALLNVTSFLFRNWFRKISPRPKVQIFALLNVFSIKNPAPEYVCVPLCYSAHWFCCTVLTIISTRDIISHRLRLHLIIIRLTRMVSQYNDDEERKRKKCYELWQTVHQHFVALADCTTPGCVGGRLVITSNSVSFSFPCSFPFP